MIDEKTPLTPNIRQLLAICVARIAIPDGGGLAAAIESLSSKERIIENSRKGLVLLNQSIEAIKAAPDNPYGEDDEVIAGVILKSLEERRTK